MPDPITLRIAQRGVLTLPKSLREAHNLKPGDTLTLLDLGDLLVLSPRPSEVDRLADRVQESLTEKGESLETVLKSLRQVREGDAPEA